MKKNLKSLVTFLSLLVSFGTLAAGPYQIENASFENWGGAKFDNQLTLSAPWTGANISQAGMDFAVVYRSEDAHTGKYSVKCMDREVGALGITEISPSWVTLGKPWSYIKGLATSSATAGTDGGINFTARPDTMSVWIKRGSSNDEHINLVYYSWSGQSRGDSYLAKDGSCSSTTHYDEESDIRTQTDPNKCGTAVSATQIAEGHFQTSNRYSEWTQIKVPIKYYKDNIPQKMNIILSASNYPEGRRNDGLVHGNYLLADDVKLIYSSKIHELRLNNEPLNKFKPDVYVYSVSLGEKATFRDIPSITCKRSGRTLSGDEITINYAEQLGDTTTITVRAEDGSSTSTYKVVFKQTESINSHAASISVNGKSIPSFSGYVTDYNVELPYGTTEAPEITVTKSEQSQDVEVVSCSDFPCVAKVIVRAENRSYETVYNINLSIGQLSDNTLQDIKINGNSIPGFKPETNTYLVELPLGTTADPTIEAVSKYKEGDQKITITNAGLNGRSTIVVTPPVGTSRTYRISYVITESSYSYLKDIQVGGVSLADFNPETTQYEMQLPLGTTKLPAITWTLGDPYQTVSVSEEGVDGTARITVKAQNGNITIYRIAFSVEKSTVTTLNNIFINGKPLDGFASDIYEYTYNVTGAVSTRPVVTWETADSYQVVTKNPASESTVSLEGVTKLTVRAQNGNSSVYSITFTQKLSDNVNLADLQVAGYNLTPAFNSEITEYTCKLNRGTSTVPAITFTRGDETQVVRVDENGVNGVAKITVKAQTGATKVYSITFSVETSSDATLKDILVGGASVDGFNPATLEYNVTLPSGTTVLPTIEAVKNDAAQRIAMIKGGVNGTTEIKVVAEDGTEQTYKLNFSVEKSLNANLKNIFIGGQPLADFNPDVMMYRYVLAENMSSCPIVKAEGYPGQTITTTMPKLVGISRIEVQPEIGSANVYTIEFVREMSDNNRLKNMMVNGKDFGFTPEQNDYTITMPEGTTQVPTVTYSKGEDKQTVQIISGGLYGTTQVVVVAEDGSKNIYSISFTVQQSANVQLKGIYVGGTLLSDFDPNKLTYSYKLNNGTTVLPEVTYKSQEGQHVSLLLPRLEGDAKFEVTSEDGAEKATYVVTFETEKLSDATLKGIFLEGKAIAGFDAQIFDYTLDITKGAKLPVVTYKKQDATQQVVVNNQGLNGCTLTVKAQSGEESTYTIQFNELVSSSALLSDIQFYNSATQTFASIDNFNENTFEYNIQLPWGTKVLPIINPVPSTYGQEIKMTEGGVNGATTILVKSADETTIETYKLNFSVEKSSVATLDNILVNGNDVPGFDPMTFEYTVSLPYGTEMVPAIDFEHAKKNGNPIVGQKVEIIDAGLINGVRINVTSEDETDKRTYILRFKVAQSGKPNVLKSIVAGQTSVPLKEGVFDYNITFPEGVTELPQLTAEKTYSEQEVRVAKVANRYVVTVISNQDNVDDVVYTITCNYTKPSMVITGVELKNNAKLYPAFSPEVTQYMAQVTNKDDIGFIYDDNAYKVAVNRTDKKVTAKISKIDDASVSKTYTFYLYAGAFSTTLSDVYLYNIDGTKEQELPLTSPISKINFEAKEGLASIGDLVLQQKVNGEWSEIWRKNIGTGWDGYSVSVNPKATSLKFNITTATTGIVRCRNVKTDLVVPAIHSLKVNGTTATRNGDNFTATVNQDFYGIPTLDIISDVKNNTYGAHWQSVLEGESYDIKWGEEVDGERKATIVYYNNQLNSFTYTLTVIRPVSIINTLKELVVEGAKNQGAKLTPAFDPERLEYSINIPYTQRELPNISVAPTSAYASVSFSHINNLSNPEAVSSINVTVTSQSGTNRMYTVRVLPSPTDESQLIDLSVEGYDIDFSSGKDHFYVTLPAGTDVLPAISYTKATDGQKVTINKGKTTTIHVKSEHLTETTYYIHFVNEEVNTHAQLDLLAVLNVDNMAPQFESGVYEYNAIKTDKHPVVIYNKVGNEDGLTVTYKKDLVKLDLYCSLPRSGVFEEASYVVNLSEKVTDNASLETIKVNGVGLTNFDAQTTDYEIPTESLDGIEIEPVLSEVGQTMVMTYDETTKTYTIVVTASDKQTVKTYTVKFVQPISDNANLSAIWIDNQMINGFDANVTEYSYTVRYTDSETPQPKWQEPVMPDIKAVGADKGQVISIETNGINGKSYINVKAENGAEKTYEIAFESQKSDYVYLKNIFKDSEAITEFYPTLNVYEFEVPVTVQRPVISYEAGDAFQVINEVEEADKHIIVVTAQSGDTFTYTINFNRTYAKNALLNGITLDGELLAGFTSNDYEYDVELPVGTTVLPIIGVINGADGQTTEVVTNGVHGDAVITVTADDNETTQTYTIHFTVDKSQVNTLLDIQLDGVSLEGFEPNIYEYTHNMLVGSRVWPLVSWTAGDAYQTVEMSETEIDTWNKVVTLLVKPEDETIESKTYTVNIVVEKSDVNTLKDIQLDNVSLEGYDAENTEYLIELPVGTKQYPLVTYTKGDEFQVVNQEVEDNRVYINVTAENGAQRTYTIEFVILHSSNATLNSISVDYEILPDFSPEKLEYNYVLPYGTTEMPIVTYEAGDKWQNISIVDGGINGDYVINVKAEDDVTTLSYIIHFSVALSNNALLSDILVDEQSMPNFDSEVFNYTYNLPYNVIEIPTVIAVTTEGQTVDIVNATSIDEVTTITVTAEDGVTKNVYTITWENEKSSNALLEMIYLDGVEVEGYDPEVSDYNITLPYGTTQMPEITWLAGDADQTVTLDWNGQVAIISVVAQDGTPGEYILAFTIEKSSENRLKDLAINGVTIEGFDPEKVEYNISYPAGTSRDEVATLDDITYQLFNESEQVTLLSNDLVLMIQVLAENGDMRTYVIAQKIELSSNTDLEDIQVNGKSLDNFSPNTLEYTYILPFGTAIAPTDITYVKSEESQTVTLSLNPLGLPTEIFVTAEDGSKAVYRIHFIVDDYDPASIPTEENVCVTRLPNGDWKFTTNCNNVTLYLVTIDGKFILSTKLPLVDVNIPNICDLQAEGYTYSGNSAQVIAYYFLHNQKNVISSGKFRVSND